MSTAMCGACGMFGLTGLGSLFLPVLGNLVNPLFFFP